MTADIDRNAAEDLYRKAQRLNETKRAVTEWMRAEGAQGNLRQNSQAPGWAAYEDAQNAFDEAVAAIR